MDEVYLLLGNNESIWRDSWRWMVDWAFEIPRGFAIGGKVLRCMNVQLLIGYMCRFAKSRASIHLGYNMTLDNSFVSVRKLAYIALLHV